MRNEHNIDLVGFQTYGPLFGPRLKGGPYINRPKTRLRIFDNPPLCSHPLGFLVSIVVVYPFSFHLTHEM